MGIMDMFRTPTPSSDLNTNGATNPNIPNTGDKSLSESPPTTNSSGKIPGTEPEDQNPLDVYKKMFENAAKNPEIVAPEFKIDGKVLNDVSTKMDFTKGIDEAVLAKATSGDVSALMSIIKQVGQNSYKAALEHSTSLTDTFLNQRGEFESKQVAKGVRSQLTSNELANAPNYSHPVVKAELNRIASQMAAANPDASPQEIAKSAQQYINDLQSALNPSSESSSPSRGKYGREVEDWTQYLGE